MKHLSKKVLAVAVTTCLCSAANAAGPTLGDVLKASSIDVNGYLDFSYTHRSTDDQQTPTFRNYDTERNSFNLHALDLAISSLPASGFGGMAELQYGRDTVANAPVGQSTTSNLDVLQAFLQYQKGSVAVMAGKYTTLAGAEVAQAPANTNFSRSFLFTFAEPVTHTGVRVTYTLNDNYKFIAGVNNGWNILNESAAGNCQTDGKCADGKTLELGVSATPIKLLSLSGAFYQGEEYSGTAADTLGSRKLLDLVATFNVNDNLNFVLNYDNGQQERAVTAGTAKWDGIAVYGNYKLNDTWRTSVRAENFKDKDGFRTGTVQKLKEVTLTVGYAPAKNAELRGEVRRDTSDQTVFTEGGTAKKNQTSFGVEGVLKF